MTVCNRHGPAQREPRQPLTDLQRAILEHLWAEGSATAERVREALAPRHPLKDSSVRTLLRRLEARGYVSHALEGKTFVYRAEVPPTSIAAGAVREIIQRFCSGSIDTFLVGMVEERVLSENDLQRLARKVRKLK
jgi:predicted transcriptional regulator